MSYNAQLCVDLNIHIINIIIIVNTSDVETGFAKSLWHRECKSASSATKSIIPDRRPATSRPQASPRLTAVSYNLFFSRSWYKVSGARYIFRATSG